MLMEKFATIILPSFQKKIVFLFSYWLCAWQRMNRCNLSIKKIKNKFNFLKKICNVKNCMIRLKNFTVIALHTAATLFNDLSNKFDVLF